MKNKLTKKQASRILRSFNQIPARTISRTKTKRWIVDELKEKYNTTIEIN